MPQVELKDNFLGGLDLDSSLFYVKRNSFVKGLNITLDAIEGSNDTTVTNIPGNRLVPYNNPMGTSTCIGRYEDTLRNCIYEFYYNTLGFDFITKFNATTRTKTKILEDKTDTGGIAILNFNLLYKINHINVLHRDEGDLLLWVDGLNAPRKINVDRFIAGTYGTIEADFISAAKEPPLTVAVVAYGDDPSINTNSLRKKLYKFKYRWVYDDFEKSTWGIISDVPLPANTVGTDNDIDPTKNNFISVIVETGNKDVVGIEIAVQSSLDTTWDDFVLATYLVKANLGISNNSTTQFNFYNNGVYPIIDVAESNLLFDWIPKIAWAQCFANGNTVIYGAITEGFDPIPADQLDVVLSVANVENTGVDPGAPSIAYENLDPIFNFTVTGGVPTGTFYKIVMRVGLSAPATVTTYTSLMGDTINDVALALYNNAPPAYQFTQGGNTFTLDVGTSPSSVIQIQIIPGTGGTTITSATTWNYNSSYKLGLVYFDQYGRTNGVVYSTAFDITTPNLEVNGSNLKTPVISASINHTPPTWAVKYIWVRTKNLTYQSFLYYVTCDFDSDTDYYYFCLQNIKFYFDKNTTFIYPSLSVAPGDRLKVLLSANTNVYTTDVYTQDFEILGVEERPIAGSMTETGNFVKVKKPIAAPSPAYVDQMLVMLYTPAKSSSATTTVFYEFGQSYNIYNLYTFTYTTGAGVFTNGETITGGTSGATGTIVVDTSGVSMTVDNITGTFVSGEIITGGTSGATATINSISSARYHRGLDQDQTNAQAATFTFTGGDIYYRLRTIYTDILTASVTSAQFNIMDANFSDFFLSAVNGNGRPEIIDINAKEQYFPVTVRFSQSYLANTSINGMNRFFFENFDDYNRDYGDIRKLYIYGPYMKVGQKYRIGNVPVELSILKNADGTDNVSISDRLLNPIYYYTNEFGVGDCPEAWASKNNSIYFIDNNRGVVCRLSQDGITPISILYKINSWATEKLPLRGFDKKIYGVFNARTNRYEFTLEATTTDPAYTMVFCEDTNIFEDERSYQPEMMGCLGTLLVMWKNGQLWTNDDFDNYNKFFGIRYPSMITPVFNDKSMIKKKYLATGYQSNEVWASPTKGDIKTNTIDPQTNLQQESKIFAQDYQLEERVLCAALNRDMNSMQNENIALWEGNYLGGTTLLINYVCPADKASKLVSFNLPYATYVISQRNI